MNQGLKLILEDVSHSWGELKVLDKISLTAGPGEVTVLVGPSGCGKSTLLNAMGGLLRPTAGTIRTEGNLADDCLNPLTYVFQDFALLPWRRVRDNISLVLEKHLTKLEIERRTDEVLTLTGLADFAHAWPKELSGGMRQRVGIARALAVKPACLLMDEPLSALDAQTRALLLDEFITLIGRANTTTIYVTHNLTEAVLLGQQIVVLSRRPGKIRKTFRISRPLEGRSSDDFDLRAMEQTIWALIRDDAATAEREIIDAAP